MKFITIAIFLLFTSAQLFSQVSDGTKYAETITGTDLKRHLFIIASAEMEGRETGTIGFERAASYIETQFKNTGLSPINVQDGYRQTYHFLKDTIMPSDFKIGRKKYQFGVDYLITRGSKKQNEFKSKEIIFLGYGIEDKNYDDYKNKNVKGKVVLIFPGEPKLNDQFIVSNTSAYSKWGRSISEKIEKAAQKGAAAILLVNPSDNILLTSQSARPLPVQQSASTISAELTIPVINIIPALLKDLVNAENAAKLIAAAKLNLPLDNFAIENKIPVNLNYNKDKIRSPASNIIGYIEGSSKKNEYVFITGHYDHVGIQDDKIYYGADDNGSGVSALLMIANAFLKAKKDGITPQRSIVFIAFSGEEKGLIGSNFYSEHPVFPLDSISGTLNIDMIGRTDNLRDHAKKRNYVYVVGNNQLSSELNPVILSANKKYTNLDLDFKYNEPNDPERIFYRSDHYNFARKGVPVLFFFDGIHEDYHQPTDTVDKINFELLEKRTRLIFYTAWEIANRNEMLKRDIPF